MKTRVDLNDWLPLGDLVLHVVVETVVDLAKNVLDEEPPSLQAHRISHIPDAGLTRDLPNPRTTLDE